MPPVARRRTTSRVPPRERLLAELAGGDFRSGEALARRLRVSRSAVWKQVRGLRALGIEVQSVPRQGYRLPRPVELYRKGRILDALPATLRSRIHRIDPLLVVDSTNRHLADQPPPPPGEIAICVAELQTTGRGRRGRTWVAPFGSGICLSLAARFTESPAALPALGLVVGVAAIRALVAAGAQDVRLKWPNDLVWQGRKLGGILIDVKGETAGPLQVVIGLGLNLRMPVQTRIMLAEQQATLVADLHEILRAALPGRNELTAALVAHTLEVLDEFAGRGFAPFADEWSAHDALAGAPVRVLAGNTAFAGIARGVGPDGALRVETGGEIRSFVSADVSLRTA